MSSSLNKNICVMITQPVYSTNALDFILAASNLTEDITVLFTGDGISTLSEFYKPLKGFGITQIFTDAPNLFNIETISQTQVMNHVTHSQYTFSF